MGKAFGAPLGAVILPPLDRHHAIDPGGYAEKSRPDSGNIVSLGARFEGNQQNMSDHGSLLERKQVETRDGASIRADGDSLVAGSAEKG